MNDSKDFQDAESVRSGTSHVTSRPVSFPPHPILEGMLRPSFVSPRRREGPPSIWDTHGISGKSFCKSTCFLFSSFFWRHNSSCRMRRSSSARAAWSSWWETFSKYSAIIICLCSSNKVVICAFELLSPTSFPVLSTIFSAWVISENLLWALYVFLGTPKPIDWSIFLSPTGFPVLSNTTDKDDWLTDTPSGLR